MQPRPAPTTEATMLNHVRMKCGKKICPYHDGKVGNTTNPTEAVYDGGHFKQVKALLETQNNVEGMSVEELIRSSLDIAKNYWEENIDALKGKMFDAHRTEYDPKLNGGKYLGGSWMSSPQQFSQMYATIWALAKKGELANASRVLRLGTASGPHAKQLKDIFPMAQEGLEPILEIIDECLPPLTEVKRLGVTERIHHGDILTEMRGLIGESVIDCLTSHAITGFTPGSDHEQSSDHNYSLQVKLKLFQEAHYVMRSGGCLAMLVGTASGSHRFNNSSEIEESLTQAGFRDIMIYDTTDPLDHNDDGTYQEGNYFVVAFA